jgi:GTP-sensing pleiotropic transcriptional regulator CodY
MPAIERRFWKSAVPVEAKKYIPIPFEALSYDYQCIPLPPDAGNHSRQGTLIAVTQKQNLSNITAMLQGLGLTIAGMEIAPCSTLKLWQGLEKGAASGSYCQVHFDGGNVRILVADKGFPVFFREVFLGEEANVADQRKLDLGGCITFAQKQLAVGALGQIIISGSTANLPAWKDAFSRELGLPVSIQDTAGMLGIKSGDWGGYSAIGASLRFRFPGAVTLDLGAVGRVTEDEKVVARDILIASGIVSLGLLLMGLYNWGMYSMRAREFGSLHRDRLIEDVFRGKNEDQISQMFQHMRMQNDLTMDLCNPQRVKMIDVIKDLVDALPEKAFIAKMTIERPIGGSVTGPTLNLLGHVVAEDSAHEQDLAFQFRNRLSTSAVAGKMFPSIKVTVQATSGNLETGGGAQNSKVYNEAVETRTSFTLVGGKGS